MVKLLENKFLRVVVYPGMGGKITSLFHKERMFEAAAQSGGAKKRAARQGFARYAYGLDDAFPNIDEEDFIRNHRKLHYPDHGEVWSADFKILDCRQDFLKIAWESKAFGYRYEKELYLKEDTLSMRYDITNIGEEELPAIWTWHGLMRYEEDMEILLPEDTKRCRNVLEDKDLGRPDTIYPYKKSVYDFSKVPAAASRKAVKYYIEPESADGTISEQSACCGFFYPSRRMCCLLQYNKEKLPYLGVWVTAGGFLGDYNCALEPSNGFYDSVSKAAANDRLPVLAPGECMDFELDVSLIFHPDREKSLRNSKEYNI